MEENKTIDNKQRIYLIVGIVLFLILVLSATYAYFQITSVNNATATTITGNGEALGMPTLTTNTTSLGLTLTTDLMSTSNSNKRLYATTNGTVVIEDGNYPYQSSTTPVTLGNGRYKLASASVAGGDISYNCTYNFDVSATVDKTMTDGSAEDVHVIVTSPKGETYRYRLDQLLDGPKTISGIITNLTPGTNQEFAIESYVWNNSMYKSNDLASNSFSFNISPKSGTNGFNCSAATSPVNTGFAKTLIDSNKMQQTGFDGDGYRFVGTGESDFCVYDGGKYYELNYGTCSTLYKVVRTTVSNSKKTSMGYRTSCPANTSAFTYSCTTLSPETDNYKPNNYICFGTTNKSTCISNLNKYMYRIIGVFPDDYGNQHVKLVKYSSIGTYQWHNDSSKIIEWKDTDLSKGLNGSYFYTNTNYDYMQNSTWRGKIADWRWNAAMSSNWGRGNTLQFHFESPMVYGSTPTQEETYLHEMNRKDKKYKTGYWSYSTAKIGLVYYSDHVLSVPINPETSTNNRGEFYTNTWLYSNNYDTEDYSWTMAADYNANSLAFSVYYSGTENSGSVKESHSVQPTFYLNSDVELASGTGTKTDPYILK